MTNMSKAQNNIKRCDVGYISVSQTFFYHLKPYQ